MNEASAEPIRPFDSAGHILTAIVGDRQRLDLMGGGEIREEWKEEKMKENGSHDQRWQKWELKGC